MLATVSVMSVEAILQATGVRLVLRVEGYQFPQFETGSDANWLVCDVQVEVQDHATFRAHLRPTLMTDELKDLATQLHALVEHRAGRAILEHIEKCIGLTIASEDGQTTVEGFVEEHTAARLEFGPAEIDQPSLQRAADQLEAIANAFPVRSSVHDSPERPIVSATCQSWNEEASSAP